MKVCHICQKTQSFSEFYKHPKTKDGYQVWCKSCISTYNQIYAKKYRKTSKGKLILRQTQKKYRRDHPQIMSAYDAVKIAIRSGKISKITKLDCCYCPNKAEQYHHHKGYAKKHWLDVIPVCKKCHRKIHKKIA